MGWRKVGDDGPELCRTLDYLLEGVQTLKASFQKGQRIDGQGEKKVNSKEIWCQDTYRCVTCLCACCNSDAHLPNNRRDSADASLDVKDAKLALRRMKNAKKLLTSVLESLGDAIQTVTEATATDCRAAGLAILPDEVLTCIFETYIEMGVMPYYGGINCNISPVILASVSKRFRRITLRLPSLWEHITLGFPKERLLLHKDRCSHPIVHINSEQTIYSVNTKMLDVIHPYQQWRELRLKYTSEYHGHLYFEHLRPMIQTPFQSLEYLLICNDLEEVEDEDSEEQTTSFSIYMDDVDLRTLCSWQMPKLAHLELQNILPSTPLQCGNVTRFSIQLFDHADEDLDMGAFQRLLQSMPRIQSLFIALNVDVTFDNTLHNPLALPSLTSLRLQIGGRTPALAISQFMAIANTRNLTRLELQFLGAYEHDESLFEKWVHTLFPDGTPAFQSPFVRVENFTLEVKDFRGSCAAFGRMFYALPNVQNVSLVLHQYTSMYLATGENDVFRHLRSLRMELPRTSASEFATHLISFQQLFGGGRCKEFERLEIVIRPSCNASEWKARLQDLLGEKLRWIES